MIHEDNGQIIVDELRPMSEVPENKFVLCLIESSKKFELLIKVPGYEMMNDDDNFIYEFCDIVGWLPMPIYRPKVK